MKTKVAFVALVFCVLFYNSYKVFVISKENNSINQRVDSIVNATNATWKGAERWPYTWFELGKDYRKTVDGSFSVSGIVAEFKDNGYQVSGEIGNKDALDMELVKIECGVDATINSIDTIVTGFTELDKLPSGVKKKFSVFVPTTERNVSAIAVQVLEYRQ